MARKRRRDRQVGGLHNPPKWLCPFHVYDPGPERVTGNCKEGRGEAEGEEEGRGEGSICFRGGGDGKIHEHGTCLAMV